VLGWASIASGELDAPQLGRKINKSTDSRLKERDVRKDRSTGDLMDR
jgi:hypothetical protein